jgi:hypothetical protein
MRTGTRAGMRLAAPAPGPGDWPESLGGRASWACAESASNDMAETKGMMIFMRLDALMRA